MANRYDYNHRRIRAALLPSAIGQPCIHCNQTMTADQPLDLDHTADRTGYRGIVHAHCNRSEGSRRRHLPPTKSRAW